MREPSGEAEDRPGRLERTVLNRRRRVKGAPREHPNRR